MQETDPRSLVTKKQTGDDPERNRMTEERGDPFAATGNRYADYAVYDDAGDEIGKVEDLFVDENGNPDHLGVKTSFLGPKTTFIPMDTARVDVRRLVEFSGSKERGADAI